MAYTRTFANLSLAVQQLGQWENSKDITPDVLLQAINYGLLEGYDAMVRAWADYYTLTTDLAIAAGTDTYLLSNSVGGGLIPTFYKLRHIDHTADSPAVATSKFTRMLPHALDGAHVYSGSSVTGRRPPRYRIQGANLVLAPMPGSPGTMRVFYIPLAPQFTSTADTTPVKFDVPIEERLVVQLAQREILERNDLPTVDCDNKIAKLTAQLRTAADSRDAGQPFYLDPRGPPRERMSRLLDDEDWY